ncbi:Zn-dependent hydrolase, including glyoxylase [Pyrobaculum oguniense TE7]|uniref:Zn-dependent hydrolase, including glyoxylase n=1 Tax=Pyrobaculum oguniense (strain DSM 13380 / JCM 10595 / TE7) TaxID=698757 RepID=H6QAC9_PYROT|nr:Zn-dependent hydrolase, including glyoxylase [Pyrobaculum oguniense TE7]
MTFSRLRLPLPGMELGHVNVYVVKCSDGYGLIDIGLATYEAALSLLRGLKALGIKPSDVTKVYVTHYHADHITLAQFLAEVASPDFHIGEGELRHVASSFEELAKMYAEEYKKHGAPADVAEAFLKIHPMSRYRKAFEDVWKISWRQVRDGEKLDCGLKAVSTPGHTPGHTVYVIEEGVFTGDHVLPRITPNISWYPLPGFNPLKEYLNSLGKIRIDTRGFPAHGEEIANLTTRVDELLKHHHERLEEVLSVLSVPMTTYEVAKKITWDAGPFDQFDVYNKIFAIGEAYSHLMYLEDVGLVEKIDGEVIRWRRVSRRTAV